MPAGIPFWTENRTALLKHLVGCKLTATEIADAFAYAGLGTENGDPNISDIADKARKLGLKFTARAAGREPRRPYTIPPGRI